MDFQALSLDLGGPIARIRLCRPDRGNGVDGRLVRELSAACEAIEDDEQARVLLLSAEGADFCRGWDLSTWNAAEESPLEWARREGLLGDPFGCLARLSRPVVAAVQGQALSAGLALALACDVRLASNDAVFGLPELEHAVLPWGGALARLARLAGRAAATAVVLTAEAIDAREALRLGLVSRVVAAERLVAEAEALAGRMAGRGPLALRYAKESVQRGLDMTLEQALRYETDLTVILQTTEDRAEGVRAFLEKRTPRFRGK